MTTNENKKPPSVAYAEQGRGLTSHNSPNASDESRSWFKAIRTPDALELVCRVPNAFRLAYIIAYRARWKDGFNIHNLQPGEALLGDFKECGMTQQEYRTAKSQLDKWGFATFTATNKGTIARLIDTRLFYISDLANNELANTQSTNNQRSGNEQTTTNLEGIEGIERKDESEGAGASQMSNNDWEKFFLTCDSLTENYEAWHRKHPGVNWYTGLTDAEQYALMTDEERERADQYDLNKEFLARYKSTRSIRP